MRWLGEIRQAFPLALHLAKAVRMIGVLVGNQDAVDVLGFLRGPALQSAAAFLFCQARHR